MALSGVWTHDPNQMTELATTTSLFRMTQYHSRWQPFYLKYVCTIAPPYDEVNAIFTRYSTPPLWLPQIIHRIRSFTVESQLHRIITPRTVKVFTATAWYNRRRTTLQYRPKFRYLLLTGDCFTATTAIWRLSINYSLTPTRTKF